VDEIETERLLLRQWKDEDVAPWAALCADPNFWRFPFGRALTSEEVAASLHRMRTHWDEKGFGLWAAVERDESSLIGYIGLSTPDFLPEILPAVEVGWRLSTNWWNRGLAT
jgi:RimJ/RimL family protein N-acetyltransferase